MFELLLDGFDDFSVFIGTQGKRSLPLEVGFETAAYPPQGIAQVIVDR